MKVFLTGGAGFIGSHLAGYLLSKGYDVTVYDNLSSGDKSFLNNYLSKDGFKFIEADLLDIKRVKKELKDHDIVFHIAANPHVRLGETQTDLDLKYGAISTYNLLESMRVNSIDKIIFSSSGVVYGETPPISISENFGPTLPISLYGAGKMSAESLITAYCGTFGFKSWIYRFANVVGSRSTHGVITDFIAKLNKNPKELEILGNGKQCKPYLYVSDCVKGIMFGLNNSKDNVNLFNLSSDGMTTVTKIAEMVVKEMNLENVEFKYTGGKRGWAGDIPRFELDSNKIRKIGWKPKFSSDESVRMAIKDTLDKN